MDAQNAIDFGREALLSGLLSIGPVLVIGLLMALGMGLIQSLFHLHDQAIGVIPKLIVMFVVLILSLPWLCDRMMDLSRTHFEKPLMLNLDGSQDSLDRK